MGAVFILIGLLQLTKRTFLKTTGLASVGVGLGGLTTTSAAPIKRKGKSRLNLSLAAYSFRDYFKTATHQQNRPSEAKSITMHDFIDYCAEQGLAGADLTSYYLDQTINKADLLKLKRHAFLRGMAISGTAVGNTFTHGKGAKRDEQVAHVKKWVDNAAVMGSPHVRVFAGNANGLSLADAQRNCIEVLEEVGDYAGKQGVFLGIENHGGIVAEADSLLKIVEATKSKWVGINLDTGNFHTDDVYGDIARCVRYAVIYNLRWKSDHAVPSRKARLILPASLASCERATIRASSLWNTRQQPIRGRLSLSGSPN